MNLFIKENKKTLGGMKRLFRSLEGRWEKEELDVFGVVSGVDTSHLQADRFFVLINDV